MIKENSELKKTTGDEYKSHFLLQALWDAA